ncbi:hypothetical protein K474DRAFT_1670807 [Panus rudis PR-1116 ss-1]|nr:hypothetical protein K474DRAFT_1670807 [Panus rudis PR-1116 ss-1]
MRSYIFAVLALLATAAISASGIPVGKSMLATRASNMDHDDHIVAGIVIRSEDDCPTENMLVITSSQLNSIDTQHIKARSLTLPSDIKPCLTIARRADIGDHIHVDLVVRAESKCPTEQSVINPITGNRFVLPLPVALCLKSCRRQNRKEYNQDHMSDALLCW